jgi:hypothetical protein
MLIILKILIIYTYEQASEAAISKPGRKLATTWFVILFFVFCLPIEVAVAGGAGVHAAAEKLPLPRHAQPLRRSACRQNQRRRCTPHEKRIHSIKSMGKKKSFVSDSVDQPIDTSSEDYARPRPNQSSKLNDLLTGDGHGVGSLAGDAKGAAAHVDVFNLALLKGGPVLLCLRRQLEDQLDGVHAVLEPRVWNHRHAGK